MFLVLEMHVSNHRFISSGLPDVLTFVANCKPTHHKKCPQMKRPISAKEKFFYYMSNKDLFRIIIIIIGDFNVGVSDPHMKNYCNAYNLSSLMKEPTSKTKIWKIHHALTLS